MANIKGKDADGSDIYLKASGVGTDIDPHIQETLDSNSAAILADTANIDTNTATLAGAVDGTEFQVDVVASLPAGTNNIGDVDIASALPAGDNNIGNVDIASALPAGDNNIGNVDVVSLPSVAVTEKALLPPLQGTIATSDDNSILDISAASGYTSGDYFVFSTILIQNNSSTDTTVLVKSGSNVLLRVVAPAKGDGILHSFPADARLKGGADEDIFLNLSGANSISYSILGYLEQ